MKYLITCTRAIVLATALIQLLAFCAFAANFDIQPVRIELSDKIRIGKITIRNVSENEFPIQIKAYEWNQNEKAEDVYRETQDIIIFPKILTIAKDEERIIRLGMNVSPGIKEKTYRIYVEEIPSDASPKEGTSVRLYMKVGIPVFVTPQKTEDKADLDDVSMDHGKIQMKVRNAGNSHFIVTGVNVRGQNAKGDELYNRDISGWYLLGGSEKMYETDVPPNLCNDISNFNIELKTSKSVIKRQLHIEKHMCGEQPITTASSR
jgi:fimbrial chaperone protein